MTGVPHDVEHASALEHVRAFIIPAAMSLLPIEMNTGPAHVMLLAIGLQESRFAFRRQVGGPARGFWQFEHGGGVRGVLRHEATAPLIGRAIDVLQYDADECFDAIEHNDVLACVFARLLLWTHPGPLPLEPAAAWAYYLATWRPGKPRAETWDDCYQRAVDLVIH